mmetsp:Transcript_16287/g.24640  ORF Transcript_16287/g.24640 Transcript_16287/m.24640 type:complete len:1099 (+) Transcript_16287:3-3299(+)
MCQRNCGTTVQNALSALPGIKQATVSFALKYAFVTASLSDYGNNLATLEFKLIEAIEDIGFDAQLWDHEDSIEHTVHLHVEGMMCQKNCGSTVERALRLNLEGVISAEASFSMSYASVTCKLRLPSSYYGSGSMVSRVRDLEKKIVHTVENVGFGANILSKSEVEIFTQNKDMNNDDEIGSSVLESDTAVGINELALDSNTATLQVKGMSCAICVGRVESMLKQIPGVTDATVVLTTHRAQITSNDMLSLPSIADACAQAVTKGGYECNVLQVGTDGQGLIENAAQMEDSRRHEMRTWRSLLITSTILSTPLIALHYHEFECLQNIRAIPYCQETIELILSTLVQLIIGRRYYKAAWKGWINGRFLGMDFLVCLGTSAAYIFSILTYIKHVLNNGPAAKMDAAFATGAMLFTFVTFGKFLESYAKGKTAAALQTLMELQPLIALKVNTSNMNAMVDFSTTDLSSLDVSEVEAKSVKVGDYLMVLPGSRIPADGVLVNTSDKSRHAYVDESALSGEPFPVSKPIGGKVIGATVNQLSTLLIRVTASGNTTVLSQIVQLMESAQAQKAPIEAQADKIASIFAPVVMALSALTLFGWLLFYHESDEVFVAIMSAISVIVVACPCALGLATPTAVMVGTGVGASYGLLIKGGAVLEGAHGVKTVIFDKTGTLTTGKAVADIDIQLIGQDDLLILNRPSSVQESKVALWMAACAEKQSEHPLAKAIVNAACSAWGSDVTCSKEGVQVEDFQIVPGSGVECLIRKPEIGEWRVRVGNRAWATADTSESCECIGDQEISEIRSSGRVGVYVSVLSEPENLSIQSVEASSVNRRVVGVLGISDPVQHEAKSTIAALHKMGVDVWMCTGDDEVTARAVADNIGIKDENVCAGVKPKGKADLVTRLQKQRKSAMKNGGSSSKDSYQEGRVAMIGDGINDSVALARADVGIAIGAGTEVAVEAADIVLVRSSLHDVAVALHLSQVVFRRIRMNFVWALAYNLIALPFAAGVFYPFTEFRLPPEFAGLMMAFSSVSVVSSSLLLRTYSKPSIMADGTLRIDGGCCWSQNCWSGCENRAQRISIPHRQPKYSGLASDEELANERVENFELV